MAVVRRLILHNCAMLNANEGINNAFFNLTFFPLRLGECKRVFGVFAIIYL